MTVIATASHKGTKPFMSVFFYFVCSGLQLSYVFKEMTGQIYERMTKREGRGKGERERHFADVDFLLLSFRNPGGFPRKVCVSFK